MVYNLPCLPNDRNMLYAPHDDCVGMKERTVVRMGFFFLLGNSNFCLLAMLTEFFVYEALLPGCWFNRCRPSSSWKGNTI